MDYRHQQQAGRLMVIKKKETTEENHSPATHSTSSLRKAAVEKLSRSQSATPWIKGENPEELIHELQVHQIELEMQAEELKRAHLVIEESRDQYLDLYEFAPIGYLTLTEMAIISQANLTIAGLLGVDRLQLTNARIRNLIIPQDLENWDRYFVNLLQSEKKLTTTLVFKRGDGTTFPARLESIRLTESSGKTSVQVAISDISDIRTVEMALHRSEERFMLALRNAPVSVAIQDTNLVFQWAYNQRTLRLEEIKGKKDMDLFIPEEAEELIELKRRTLKTGKKIHKKIWLTMDGKRLFLDLYIEPLFDDTGHITGIGVATVDLTEQKLIEDALRHSEENFRQALELLEAVTKETDVIIAVQDVNFCYLYFNQAYQEEIQRLTSKDLTIGTSMIELYAEMPEEQKKDVKEWEKVLKGEYVNKLVEFNDPGTNRRVYHVLHTPIRDANGTIIGAGEVAYDVTRQVLVNEELRETKEYLDNLITCANAPIIVWDSQFFITRFNRAFEHLTGREAKEVLGKHLEILLPDSYLVPAMDLLRKTSEGEPWDSVEIPILDKMGGIRTVLWNSASIFGSDGKTIVSTIAQGQDITDRKKIECEHRLRAAELAKMNMLLNEEIRQRNISDTALKNTLSLLNATLESTADGILVVDQQGKITSYNQNFVTLWNIPGDLLESGKNFQVMNHLIQQLKNPEEFVANIKEYQFHPTRESFDMIECKDGKIFERYVKPQKIGDIVVGIVWSFRDITDRRHTEEKLVASLQEKEVLLREIHHRVKNNLQLISGLLDMTRMRTVDKSTNSVLTDIMLKIQTMAQIHTRLYESKQCGKISITDQIQDQITALSNIYSHKGHEITCEIHSREVFLPVDQALPCALVVNELLSNAYKHAFKKRKKGNIEISAVQENGWMHITVSDNGIGMSDDFDISRCNSLGLKLMSTLVQHQLKGSLTINSNQGTEINVKFPVII